MSCHFFSVRRLPWLTIVLQLLWQVWLQYCRLQSLGILKGVAPCRLTCHSRLCGWCYDVNGLEPKDFMTPRRCLWAFWLFYSGMCLCFSVSCARIATFSCSVGEPRRRDCCRELFVRPSCFPFCDAMAYFTADQSTVSKQTRSGHVGESASMLLRGGVPTNAVRRPRFLVSTWWCLQTICLLSYLFATIRNKIWLWWLFLFFPAFLFDCCLFLRPIQCQTEQLRPLR